jgi:hypothetical protein
MFMRIRRFWKIASIVLVVYVHSVSSWGYGGGGGSSGTCKKPQFFSEKPADGNRIPLVAGFSFLVSADTDENSVQVEIGPQKFKPALRRLASGDWEGQVQVDPPITSPGRLRIAITARSREGCSGFKPLYVEIRPQ